MPSHVWRQYPPPLSLSLSRTHARTHTQSPPIRCPSRLSPRTSYFHCMCTPVLCLLLSVTILSTVTVSLPLQSILASWDHFSFPLPVPGLRLWRPGLDASLETAIKHRWHGDGSHHSKAYSETPDLAFFHPTKWLWVTFIYFCPELGCPCWLVSFRQHVSRTHQNPANQFYPSLSLSRCSQDSSVVLCCCFSFCLELIIVIHSSLVALKNLTYSVLLVLSVVLPGLTTHLRSFVLPTCFVWNPVLSIQISIQFFFLPLIVEQPNPFLSVWSLPAVCSVSPTAGLLGSFVFSLSLLVSASSSECVCVCGWCFSFCCCCCCCCVCVTKW